MPPRLLEELKRQLKCLDLYPILDTFNSPRGVYSQTSHRQYKWSIAAVDLKNKQSYLIYSYELTATQCSRGKQKFYLKRSTEDYFTFNVIGVRIKK